MSDHMFGISKTTFQSCKTSIWIANISFLGLWAWDSLLLLILYSSCHKSGISLSFSKIVIASLWLHMTCSAQRQEKQPVLLCSVLYLPAMLFVHRAGNLGTTFLWKLQQRRVCAQVLTQGSGCGQDAHLSWGTSQFHCLYVVTGTSLTKYRLGKQTSRILMWLSLPGGNCYMTSYIKKVWHNLDALCAICLHLLTTTGFSWLSGELRSLERSSFQTHEMLS